MPVPSRELDPRMPPSYAKLIDPVGVVASSSTTWAVKVTVWPGADGFVEALRETSVPPNS
jgi:hypothetical protein